MKFKTSACPVNSVASKDISSGHASRKKGTYKDKKSKRQHAVDIESGQESSKCDDDFDLSARSIDFTLFAPVVFHSKGVSSQSYKITGKVDTGAMVSCMPTSMLLKIGLSKKDLNPSDAIICGMSGAGLQNC